MDKTILKKFAIESRKDLMEKISNKIKTFYVDEEFKSEQKGDLYILSNDIHTLSLTNEEYKKRELLIKRIKELSLEQVIEEAAYTWFNRIIAIRYMEIHDYLPLTKNNQSLGIRVLSSKDNTPDPEIMKFTNLVNPDLDIEFKKEKYVELKDDNEKFKYVLLLVCKKLGRVIPQVFDGVTDYIDILIPENLLNDTGFITKVITEVPEENYNQVEIIGWLYQYYNQTEKDRVMASKKAYKKNEIAYATQLFTPKWIVKYMVQNALGRYWEERNESNTKKNNWEYYLELESNVKNKKMQITDLTFIDPCCGSGHILLYAFEFLYSIYLENGYNKNGIAEIILKNNIYGLDIDDRAGQLSVLSVLLKAREYDKNIFNKNVCKNCNIFSIQESNNISNSLLDYISEKNKDIAEALIENFKNAKEIGSLLKLQEYNYEQLEQEILKNDTIFGIELKEKIIPLIKVAKVISKKYDVMVTNPPYLNSSVMTNNLKEYLNNNYKFAKNDLFAAFIDSGFVKENGYQGMITMEGWMFLGNFEKFREELLKNKYISSLIHMPYLGKGGTSLGINFGNVAFVLKNSKEEKEGIYQCIRYYETNEDGIPLSFPVKNERYNITKQNRFNTIPGKPIAYWVGDSVLKPFFKSISIDSISDYTGSQNKTADNERYLRKIWEVDKNKVGKDNDWVFYAKGGEYRKHYGNIDLLVNWTDSARNFYSKNSTSNLLDKKYWYKEGITYTMLSSRGNSFRYLPENCVFDMGGPSICSLNEKLMYVLSFLNTKLAALYLNLFNPTINLQAKDVKALPLILDENKMDLLTKIESECVKLSKQDWDSFETSWDFKTHPLVSFRVMAGFSSNGVYSSSLKNTYDNWESQCNLSFNKLKQNEEELNRIFIDIYGLQDELTPEVEDKDITIRKADRVREVKSLISYAVGCMFGRYSLDEQGLVYAGGEFDNTKYKTFKADVDNIIPITDEAYFGDDIVERFKVFIKTVYGDNTFNENMDFIAETLGKKGTETSEDTVRRYFLNDFFNDHTKIYQKRPIYWLFDSGKKNGFKALVYMHRYNENLIPKVRLDYLHRIQTTYEKLLSDVNDKLKTELSTSDKKTAQNRQADLNAKLTEIKEYDEKIAHIANQRISIDLDDGVKVNYDKFKDILAKIK